ncbi:MAG: MarR family winged helix-turn-helix transcriptional regulator, partial [Actinoallomurus sp.]
NPDPGDRRGVLVRLTDAGRTRVDAAFDDLIDRERHLLGSLTPDDRRTLADLLRSLLGPFDANPTG